MWDNESGQLLCIVAQLLCVARCTRQPACSAVQCAAALASLLAVQCALHQLHPPVPQAWSLHPSSVADPPNVEMYVQEGTLSNGFPDYRCIRGQGQLESFHALLAKLPGFNMRANTGHARLLALIDWCAKQFSWSGAVPRFGSAATRLFPS